MSVNLDNYIGVHERIEKFYADFPNGRINTEIINLDIETGMVVIKASIFREKDDAEPSATGHAYEIKGEGYVNKTSHIENCETSACGRALAFLGYEIQRGIASKEEMQKVQRVTERLQNLQQPKPQPNGKSSEAQSKAIYAISRSKGVDENKFIAEMMGGIKKAELSSKEASHVIEALNAL